MSLHDPDHPVWPLLRMTVVFCAIAPVLWMNATNFDETEIRSIVLTVGVVGAVDFAMQALRKRNGHK